MKQFLYFVFTWWKGQTFGTWFHTRFYGEFVGEDEFGNRYYRTRGGAIDPLLLFGQPAFECGEPVLLGMDGRGEGQRGGGEKQKTRSHDRHPL